MGQAFLLSLSPPAPTNTASHLPRPSSPLHCSCRCRHRLCPTSLYSSSLSSPLPPPQSQSLPQQVWLSGAGDVVTLNGAPVQLMAGQFLPLSGPPPPQSHSPPLQAPSLMFVGPGSVLHRFPSAPRRRCPPPPLCCRPLRPSHCPPSVPSTPHRGGRTTVSPHWSSLPLRSLSSGRSTPRGRRRPVDVPPPLPPPLPPLPPPRPPCVLHPSPVSGGGGRCLCVVCFGLPSLLCDGPSSCGR